jgi:hypothetical protein
LPEERAPVAPSAYDGAREVVDWLTGADRVVKLDPDALRHCPIPVGAVLRRSALLLRDIVGNPFRSVAADPSWLTATVVTLARQMYEGRSFSLMPILADALQDAGCGDEAVLSHCRGNGPHIRGCWVVDLVLGKA